MMMMIEQLIRDAVSLIKAIAELREHLQADDAACIGLADRVKLFDQLLVEWAQQLQQQKPATAASSVSFPLPSDLSSVELSITQLTATLQDVHKFIVKYRKTGTLFNDALGFTQKVAWRNSRKADMTYLNQRLNDCVSDLLPGQLVGVEGQQLLKAVEDPPDVLSGMQEEAIAELLSLQGQSAQQLALLAEIRNDVADTKLAASSSLCQQLQELGKKLSQQEALSQQDVASLLAAMRSHVDEVVLAETSRLNEVYLSSVSLPAPPPKPLIAFTGHVFTSYDALKQAVDMWCNHTTLSRALTEYGHISTWNTSQVTSMHALFKDKSDFNGDISSWDVSNVTSMYQMFYGAKAFNHSLETWDVSNVTSVDGMLYEAEAFNQPICTWNVSNVTRMECMFYGAFDFNQPIGSWNVSNVTNMDNLLCGAEAFNQPIGSWNVSKVTSMNGMFYDAKAFNQPIGAWDVSYVTRMECMFYGSFDFNQPIDSWVVSKVTNMDCMFSHATAFNQPIGMWNVSNVNSMDGMFCGAKAFNQPIGTWDVSYKVTSMNSMFFYAEAFNQPIGCWNVSNVTSMAYMFSGAKVFNQPLGAWDVSKVTCMQDMFYCAMAFNQPIGTWNMSNKVTSIDCIFFNAQSFN